LAHDLVQVGAEPSRVNSGCRPEESDRSLGGDEAVAAQWSELAYGNAVARDDERLALVELAHDLTAVVAQFSLGDLSAHGRIVARVLQDRIPYGRTSMLATTPAFGAVREDGSV